MPDEEDDLGIPKFSLTEREKRRVPSCALRAVRRGSANGRQR